MTDEPDALEFGHLQTCARIVLRAAGFSADGTSKPERNEGEQDIGGALKSIGSRIGSRVRLRIGLPVPSASQRR